MNKHSEPRKVDNRSESLEDEAGIGGEDPDAVGGAPGHDIDEHNPDAQGGAPRLRDHQDRQAGADVADRGDDLDERGLPRREGRRPTP